MTSTFRRALAALAILAAALSIPMAASAATPIFPSVAAFRAAYPSFCKYDAATNTTTLRKSITLKRSDQLTVLKGETLVIPKTVRLNTGSQPLYYTDRINTQGVLRYYTTTETFLSVGKGIRYETDEVFPHLARIEMGGEGTIILKSPQASGMFNVDSHVILTGAANLDQCGSVAVSHRGVLDLTETTAKKHTLRNLDCRGTVLLGGRDLDIPTTHTVLTSPHLIGGGTLTLSGPGIMNYYDAYLDYDGTLVIDGGALHFLYYDKEATISRPVTNRGIMLVERGTVAFQTMPDNAAGLIQSTDGGTIIGLNAHTFDGAGGETVSARLGTVATSVQFHEPAGPVNLKKYLGVFSRAGHVQTGWMVGGETVATDAVVTLKDGDTVSAAWTRSSAAPKNEVARKKPLMIKGQSAVFTSLRSLRYNSKGDLEISMFIYNRTKQTFHPGKLPYLQLKVYYGDHEYRSLGGKASLKSALLPGHVKTYKTTLKAGTFSLPLNLTSPDLHFVLRGNLNRSIGFTPLCVTNDGVVDADSFVIDVIDDF